MNNNTLAIDAQTPVLIVDDSPQFSIVLNRLLSGVFGFKAISVLASADDALRRISSKPTEFPLVFLDFHFPNGMSGGDLLTIMAEKGWLEGKVVFLMSSDPTAEALQRVVKSGAAGIITKPFDRDELKRQLDRAGRMLSQLEKDSF